MIHDITHDIMPLIITSIEVFKVFLILILIIVVAVSIFNKELESSCSKGFAKLFIIFLSFLLFSKFFEILFEWFISWNIFIAFIILSIAMELYLINEKSNWKFGVLAIILLIGSFIFSIVEFILEFVFGSGMRYFITSTIVSILTNINYLFIGIVFLAMLAKTANENASLEIYTKPISNGMVLLFIIIPLIAPIPSIVYILWNLSDFSHSIHYWISQGVFFIESLLFITGIIFLTVGALKTMSVPLIFSKKKKRKKNRRILRKPAKRCSKCDTPIPLGAGFCINCGKLFS